MSTFPSVTKQQIREMNAEFSSICTSEEKDKSTSPFHARKIYIAPRRRGGGEGRRAAQDNDTGVTFRDLSARNPDHKFQQMSNEQYKQYQHDSMQRRMKRKRNFDAFSSHSDSSLLSVLQKANTFRVPYHCMFYVRANQNEDTAENEVKQSQNNNENENENKNKNGNERQTNQSGCSSSSQNQTANAFDLLIKGSKSMTRTTWASAESRLNLDTDDTVQDEQKGTDGVDPGDDDEDAMMHNAEIPHVIYPIFEECSITRSVRVSSEWVQAYVHFDAANDMAWKQLNPQGKIHEYQINRSHGITLVNLDESPGLHGAEQKRKFWRDNEQVIKQWVLDHSYCGLIVDGCFYLYQPHLYWNLLDDDKQCKVKQALISDMFQSAKTKPGKSPWKCTFQK